MTAIGSRDNPRVRRWRDLAEDSRTRRKERRAIIEGEHLVAAFLDSGRKVEALIVREGETARFEGIAKRAGGKAVVVTDSVFKVITDTETPSGIAAEIAIPEAPAGLERASTCVFLDSIQDAGNVGAILRSAAAFGIRHAVLGKGCADAWSSKVLRAGMGAHFSMAIEEQADLARAITRYAGKVACTVVRDGIALKDADLSGRLGWIFGSEGRGVSDELGRLATLKVMIPMPGSAESLNVAAAAAICFYELSRRAARS
jgi:TrmH family RNA methyltransferase